MQHREPHQVDRAGAGGEGAGISWFLAMTSHLGGAMFGNTKDSEVSAQYSRAIHTLVDDLMTQEKIEDAMVQAFYNNAHAEHVKQGKEGEVRTKRSVTVFCFGKAIPLGAFSFFVF